MKNEPTAANNERCNQQKSTQIVRNRPKTYELQEKSKKKNNKFENKNFRKAEKTPTNDTHTYNNALAQTMMFNVTKTDGNGSHFIIIIVPHVATTLNSIRCCCCCCLFLCVSRAFQFFKPNVFEIV